jgi:predicted GIY-YIG superfamily endonuclease
VKEHQYFVYIMSSRSGTLYIGITNSIYRRALQHKRGEIEGRQQVRMYSPGLLRRLRRCPQSNRQRKAAKRMDAGEEDRLD